MQEILRANRIGEFSSSAASSPKKAKDLAWVGIGRRKVVKEVNGYHKPRHWQWHRHRPFFGCGRRGGGERSMRAKPKTRKRK
jgi:hypothetical protein